MVVVVQNVGLWNVDSLICWGFKSEGGDALLSCMLCNESCILARI